jgi:3-oxoacyl-[acyl-carrier-protein] synthase-3
MIQDQLNLKKNIIAFDIGLGCSGFVYGLSVINSLLSSNTVKTVYLFVVILIVNF